MHNTEQENMMQINRFKKFLESGEMPQADALDEAIEIAEAQDGVLGRIAGAARAGISAAKQSWKASGTLADHDRRFHPGGYKEGDSCKLREDMAKSDKEDNIGASGAVKPAEPANEGHHSPCRTPADPKTSWRKRYDGGHVRTVPADKVHLDNGVMNALKSVGTDAYYDLMNAFPNGVPVEYSDQYDGLIDYYQNLIAKYGDDAGSYSKIVEGLKADKDYWENWR